MITQLEIKNFRNIPYAMYSFAGSKTVLYGANGMPKSLEQVCQITLS